ncbi:MAG: hypothetical protein RML94_10225, partial [Bacteroidia bacterium]|nr:hypothetical protein [Bacteroidia bacterium]
LCYVILNVPMIHLPLLYMQAMPTPQLQINGVLPVNLFNRRQNLLDSGGIGDWRYNVVLWVMGDGRCGGCSVCWG